MEQFGAGSEPFHHGLDRQCRQQVRVTLAPKHSRRRLVDDFRCRRRKERNNYDVPHLGRTPKNTGNE